MSVYETSITNPKKQLEFYKQLSEQLQQENQQLKIQISAREEEYRKLEDNWNELKEYIREEWYCFNNESVEYKVSLDILDEMQELERGVSDEQG